MSAEGKIARLRRELAEAEKEAGVPVSGEPVARTVSAEQWRSLAESATVAIQIGESIKERAKRLGLPCPTCGREQINELEAEIKRLQKFEDEMTAARQVLKNNEATLREMAGLRADAERLHKDAAVEALRHAAKVVELFDDATMQNDYMIDSKDCAEILEGLAEYHAALAAKGETK